MKYIKNNEEYTSSNKIFDKKFWLLNTNNPELQVSLYKIGIDINDVERYAEYYQKERHTINSIKKDCFFSVYSYFDEYTNKLEPYWSHQSHNVANKKKLLEMEYKYMGKVKLTSKDHENYEIQKNANIYNL